jgi:hypothetical protein
MTIIVDQYTLTRWSRPIQVRLHGRQWTFDTLARELGVTARVIYLASWRSDTDWEFSLKVADIVYRKKLGLPSRTRIYRRGKTIMYSRAVMDLTGLKAGGAIRRLVDWEEGRIAFEKLTEPVVSPKKQAKPKKKAVKTTPRPKKKENLGLSPRRSIGSLPSPGSWEKEHIGN